ncbi:hypothetical protein P7K49_010769 [Saguinus oedipus]|uniref:Peptidase S1 domain-containing protein n=1 Tax=Saguinus oedipus TaxID=9490 RepID=A0ABQ9VR31_SAGOE|nr:hypothetical protein P7K49_010769 [Saguinus oedipus]
MAGLVQACWMPGLPHLVLQSVLLKPLHISICRDDFLPQPDCLDLKDSLPNGFQCTRLSTGPSELVVADGTPLVCSQAGSWLLQGVMTWGPCLEPCLPGVYISVNFFISWIRDNVSNVSFDTSANRRS